MKTKILNIICILFGLMFINSGLNKFFGYMPMPSVDSENFIKDNMALIEIAWLLPLVGLAEVIGGLLFIIPRSRALGAIIIFPILLGILLIHCTVAPQGLPMAIILWIILLWVMFENRNKYLVLIEK